MKKFTIQRIVLMLSVLIAFGACQDKWDEHFASPGSDANKSLYVIINEDAQFSKFAELLDKSGYADELKSSKKFTVILPNNAAVEEAATSVNFTDSAALRAFVGYHIINSAYMVNPGSDTVRARNLRAKYVDFVNGNFNNIVPNVSDQVAENGVYHVVSHALTAYKNIYDFLLNFGEASLQKQALLSFDTAKVVGDTTLIFRSASFVNNVYRPMNDERQRYTYFILQDAFFQSEYNKLSPFYNTSYQAAGPRPDSTTEFFTKMNLLRDFIVAGNFAENDMMTDTLTSLSGFKFMVDPSKIISSHTVSNGRVYYVSSLPYKLKDQIREFKVMGNLPRGFSQADKSGNTFYRNKIDTLGNLYNDIEVYDHQVAEFYISYLNRASYKVRYKVWGRAISGLLGDSQKAAFTQYVHFFNPATGLFNKPVTNPQGTSVAKFTYDVASLYHNEVYLGEYVQEEFGNLNLRLVSAPSRSVNVNTLILEYLRFEPILPN